MHTKQELLAQLTNARNNYLLGLASLSLLTTPSSLVTLRQNEASFGPYRVQFEAIVQMLTHEGDRTLALTELLTMHYRALIKECFEALKDYCETSKQMPILTAQPWYQFARLLRNCMSHKHRFEFSAYDLKLLPISWKTRTITATHQGKVLPMELFGLTEAWELFVEFEGFATSQLREAA